MKSTEWRILAFYSAQSPLSSPGRHAGLFNDSPDDVAGIIRIIQGLLIYEHVAKDFYGVDLAPGRNTESHIRPVEAIFDRLLALDDRPLSVARQPEKRVTGICRHFMLLTVAMLRAKNIPARARVGFGTYFNPPYFEDHWVCEYWNKTEQRWILIDPQFDAVWLEHFQLDHDILDVPRNRFIVAGDAWLQCRNGTADPSKFGISFQNLRGLWFIAGSLVREVAALNRMELLPWDVWGGQTDVNASLDRDQLAVFDRIAALTRTPDESFDELRRLFQTDRRLQVPDTVFNALIQREETVMTG